MVNTLWFWFDLIRFRNDFSVCVYGREIAYIRTRCRRNWLASAYELYLHRISDSEIYRVHSYHVLREPDFSLHSIVLGYDCVENFLSIVDQMRFLFVHNKKEFERKQKIYIVFYFKEPIEKKTFPYLILIRCIVIQCT